MKVPAAALKNVLSARGLDVATLALRSGVSRKVLQRAINDDGELEDDDISSIADELAVPVQALFARKSLPLFPAVDFRTATPRVGEFAKGTLQAINFVERFSTTLAALNIDVSLDPVLQQYKTAKYSKDEAWKLADLWRKRWGVKDDDQLDWQDANKLYTSFRRFVENLGIVVVHRQFKTDEAAGIYVHVDGGPHTIVINTTGSGKPRKLFTLAHEFGHVLLRAEGASNPSVIRNRVERFCNWFAAALLAPKRLIERVLEPFQNRAQANSDFIRRFAKKLGISQEAAFLRLVETGYLQQSDYDAWKARFDNTDHVPTADMSDGGGGGTANPLRDKQTQYGSTLLRLLGQARRTGELDEIDIYRLCGLKPKYQDQLFGVA